MRSPVPENDKTHRIPSGTRDVLPDEMSELRAITDALRDAFAASGYGEVSTPALEYEPVLAAGAGGASEPAYRLFDEEGNVFVLRSDMTIPIARLVGTRYPDEPVPLRFCYLANAYRAVRPQRGQRRELLQAGIELIGSPSPEGTAEALTVLCSALDAVGLADYRVGLGDASLYPALLDACGVPADRRAPLLHELVTRDFVGLERRVHELGVGAQEADALVRVPQVRGAPEVLDGLPAPAAGAVTGLRSVHALLAPAVAQRLIFDLGLVRNLGYYTGAVFDVYDPALGAPLGGGGRYDELLGGFGRTLPAVGFALNVEQLHIALTGEERRRR
jgi:ATP phosphoribosyltransferase regulatory subunit